MFNAVEPVCPCTTERALGAALTAILPSSAADTVSGNDVVPLTPPAPVARTVSGYVPGMAAADAASVICVLGPVAGLGVNVAETPAGAPSSESERSPVNAPVRVSVTGTALAAEVPCASCCAAIADTVTPGGVGTVSAYVALAALTPAPLALSVSV